MDALKFRGVPAGVTFDARSCVEKVRTGTDKTILPGQVMDYNGHVEVQGPARA
jgi:hypothetical protein